MLRVLISIFYLCAFSLFSYSSTQNTKQNHLTKEISECFFSFLQSNYAGDTTDLYRAFLEDLNASLIYKKTIEFLVKKDQVEEVNKNLFVRDNEHYYYYFPEVFVVKEDDYSLTASLVEELQIPIVLTEQRKIVDSRHPGYYKTLNITLNKDGGFWKEIKGSNDNPFVSYLINQIERTGEVSYLTLSSFFSTSEYRHLLEKTENRQLLAILFWKFLCLEANIDFYLPATAQPWQITIDKYILR